jgi:hypothetical protein
MKRHKWDNHSVTEVNGAGVQVEHWQECSICGDQRTQWESPFRKECPGRVAMPMPVNGLGEPYQKVGGKG